MTAFASHTNVINDQDHVTWWIKTLNYKTLDIQCRLPTAFLHVEPLLRAYIKSHISRGRIEIRLEFRSDNNIKEETAVNKTLIKQLLNTCKEIAQLDKTHTFSSIDIFKVLSWPGVMKVKQNVEKDSQLDKKVLQLFEQTLDQVMEKKLQEGKALQHFLYRHLESVEAQLAFLNTQLPMLRKKVHQRIINVFEKFGLEVNREKLEQELVFSLQRMDVTEEMERLVIHVNECKKQLSQPKVKGVQLDFLMQELIRESNSLSAKIGNATLNLRVIDIKVLIDAMREQIQNIE